MVLNSGNQFFKTSANTVALSVRDLQAWYGESHVLLGIDFNVEPGEVVTLLGRNGAGKTTTLKSIRYYAQFV
jgi:branched-chain amino acid transport system ATP-binding protein